jgi:hypothetical protein
MLLLPMYSCLLLFLLNSCKSLLQMYRCCTSSQLDCVQLLLLPKFRYLLFFSSLHLSVVVTSVQLSVVVVGVQLSVAVPILQL